MSGEHELVQLLLRARWRKAANWVLKKPNKVRNYRLSGGRMQGSTVLHLACSLDPPVKLVVALLEAYPEATSEQNIFGFTPLHVASSFASPMVVKTLLEADIGAIHINGVGNVSPLQLLCLKYGDKIREVLDKPQLYKSHLEGTIFCFRSKASHLLRAEYHRTVSERLPDQRCWRMVHACAGLQDCPTTLLQFALKVYPKQVTEIDEDGNLPLHIAAAAATATAFHDQTSKSCGLTHSDRSVISCLISAYPDAAKVYNRKRQLPIHLAILSGKEWHEGVECIFNANPSVITKRDEVSDLYLFMFASASQTASLSTVYRLFRACPEVTRYCNPYELGKQIKTRNAKRKVSPSLHTPAKCRKHTVTTRSMSKKLKTASSTA